MEALARFPKVFVLRHPQLLYHLLRNPDGLEVNYPIIIVVVA